MNPPPEPTTDDTANPAETERPSLGRSVGSAARLLESDALSTGDRAELRRISPDAPFTPALWQTLHRLGQHEAPGWIGQSRWERRWATLLMGMAFCTGFHDYGTPLGRALARAGWSELRFVRLLRADGETLEAHLRRVAQYLASKNQPANWADVANLLFYQSGETAEDIRLSIARSYYGARYAAEKEQTG